MLQLTGKSSTLRCKQYITVARTVCASGSHLAILDAMLIASVSLIRWLDIGDMHLIIAGHRQLLPHPERISSLCHKRVYRGIRCTGSIKSSLKPMLPIPVV